MQTKQGKESKRIQREFREGSRFMGSYRLQGEYSLYSEQESKALEGFEHEQEKADLHTVKQPLVHQRPPLLSILLLRTCS